MSSKRNDSLSLKRFLSFLSALILTGMLVVHAEDSFHIYAPSRASSELLVVEAKEVNDSLELKMIERKPLGSPFRTIAMHPEKPVLYVGSGAGKKGAYDGASIELAQNGKVAAVHPTKLNGAYSYLSLDRANRFLLGASYGGGEVDIYSLDDTGRVEKRVAGLDEGRKNAHAVLVSRDNRFLYIPYVKDMNALYQYSFNPQTGAVKPLKPKNAQPPEGTGPRHIAYHPTLPVVYFSNEQGVGLSVYRSAREEGPKGALVFWESVPALPEGMDKDGISSSDLVITPDGKFLFVGVRGHRQDFDRIARYAIQNDGRAKLLGLTKADQIPWGFALSPDARHLCVSAFKGGTLKVYRINEDGALDLAASLEIDPQISDLVTRQ